jgi:hypothetical protein
LDGHDQRVRKKGASQGMQKALLLGALVGAGATAVLVAAFVAIRSNEPGEAGADWAFVALLASPFFVGGGGLIGMALAAIIRSIRSSYDPESESNGGCE